MVIGLNIIDFILFFVLVFMTCLGFFFGLIRVVGSIATIIVGILTAGLFFESLAPVLRIYLFNNANLSNVVAFILIYAFTSLLLSVIIKIANTIFSLPILKTVNRLFGGIVAFLSTMVVLSVFFHLFKQYAWSESFIGLLSQSTIIQMLSVVGEYVSWLIPGL